MSSSPLRHTFKREFMSYNSARKARVRDGIRFSQHFYSIDKMEVVGRYMGVSAKMRCAFKFYASLQQRKVFEAKASNKL